MYNIYHYWHEIEGVCRIRPWVIIDVSQTLPVFQKEYKAVWQVNLAD